MRSQTPKTESGNPWNGETLCLFMNSVVVTPKNNNNKKTTKHWPQTHQRQLKLHKTPIVLALKKTNRNIHAYTKNKTLASRAQHTEMVQIAFILPVQTFKTKQKRRNALQEALTLVKINSSRGNQKEIDDQKNKQHEFFFTIWKAQNDQFGILRQWRKK